MRFLTDVNASGALAGWLQEAGYVETLSKMYRIGRAQRRHDTLRDALAGTVRGLGGRLRRNGSEPRATNVW